MADGVSVAERVDRETGAVWDLCELCGAKRRLIDSLCYVCRADPVKVELVQARLARAGVDAEVRKLRKHIAAQGVILKSQRLLLHQTQKLENVDYVLPMSQPEYLLLVSILVDIVAEDPTSETFALHRKVHKLSPRRPIPDDSD